MMEHSKLQYFSESCVRQSLGEKVFWDIICNANNNIVKKTLSLKLYKEKDFPYRN